MRGGARLAFVAVAAQLAFALGIPAQASALSVALPTVEVSSGGDPARHVCWTGAPCTTQYAPLLLSVDDRVDVEFSADVTGVRLGRSSSDPGRPCAAAGMRRWRCLPPGQRGSARTLTLAAKHIGGDVSWVFDVRLLPRGFRATDRHNGVRFRLAGRHLRAQLAPIPDTRPADARSYLWGKEVTAVCRARGKGRTVVDTMRWPKGRLTINFSFARSLGGPPRWCVIEDADDGGDYALVRFPRRR